MQSIAHSPLTLFKPRRRNCLKPLACLICPNTGSTTCFRRRGDLLFRKPAALHSPGLLAGQTLRQNGNISGEPVGPHVLLSHPPRHYGKAARRLAPLLPPGQGGQGAGVVRVALVACRCDKVRLIDNFVQLSRTEPGA